MKELITKQKSFFGLDTHKPIKAAPGTTYWAYDSGTVYIYNADGNAAAIGGAGGDTDEWATYTGTRATADLLLIWGDYDDSGNGTKVTLDDDLGRLTVTGEFGIIAEGAAFGGVFVSDLLTGDRTYDLPDADGVMATQEYVDTKKGNVVSITSGYTLLASDANRIIRIDMASLGSIIVPPQSSVDFKTYTEIKFANNGSNNCFINPGSGVTIETDLAQSSCPAGAMRTLIKVGTDLWVLGN